MEDKNPFVERLLDSALAQRRKAEPRPGLEGRILERVRMAGKERAASQGRWKGWWVVGAMAAIVFIVAVVHKANRQHRAAVSAQVGNAVSVPPASKELNLNSGLTTRPETAPTVLTAKRQAIHDKARLRSSKTPRWPMQFATPAPLSPEEKALIWYVRETPPQVLAASLQRQRLAIEPIEIKPLEIAPLEIEPLQVDEGIE